jgi:hypothetical protein
VYTSVQAVSADGGFLFDAIIFYQIYFHLSSPFKKNVASPEDSAFLFSPGGIFFRSVDLEQALKYIINDRRVNKTVGGKQDENAVSGMRYGCGR